jgi:F-type H+-transporting ATPase subunit delta
MVAESTIARPYARAAFNVALADKTINEWAAALQTLSLFVRDDRVNRLLKNPHVGNQQVCEWIKKQLGSKLNTSHQNFLQQLAKAKRLNLLPEITQQFLHLKDEQEKVIVVEVITAMPLQPKMTELVTAALEKRFARKVQLDTKIDGDILGGAIFRANDLVLDGSVKGKLKELECELLGN